MLLIIKNLPTSLTTDRLEDLLFPAINGRIFNKESKIHAIKIMALLDKHRAPVEVHALVWVAPVDMKKRLIKTLKALSMDGRQLDVSEYIARSISHDRRTPGREKDHDQTKDRRVFQRRLTNADMITISEKTYT